MESNIITTTCKVLSNVAVVDEINAIRAQIIANRTSSVANGITKAAMIAVAKEKMRGGVCHFIYVKKNGELREAFGTLAANIVPQTNGTERKANDTVQTYFDTEKQAWRCYKKANLVRIAI